MKIAYYTSNRVLFPPSPDEVAASSSVTFSIVNHLKDNHDITVYAPKGSVSNGFKIKDLDFPPFSIDASLSSNDWLSKSSYGLKEIFLYELAKEADQYDIIHLQTEPVYMGMGLINLIETPILFTAHHPFYETDRKIFEYYDGKINFSGLSDYHVSKFPLQQKKYIVHNGIDIENYNLNLMNTGDYFLFLGRLTEHKGVLDFIELAKNNPDSKFVIVGTGPLKQVVEDNAKKLRNLDFRGFLEKGSDEWTSVYRNAKAFICPIKKDESFGLVMIEAMAFGTPVIAYDAVAAPEIIENGKSGLLATRATIAGISECIKNINNLSEQELIKMRECARKRVAKDFTSSVMADKYEKIYYELIKK